MAASSPRKRLQDEVTCCICLEFFAQPVTLDCGHNFCRACIETCWGDASADAPETAACPQCREKVERRSLKPNRQLANFVEIAKELTVQPRPADGRWKVCELHEEPLKLFCRDDKAPICVVCDRSKEHREHNVVPLEEASQEKEREKILKLTEKERQRTVDLFRQLHQFLAIQEELLLAQMDEVKQGIAKKREEHMAVLTWEISSLESLIQELEEKCQQPAGELVQVRRGRGAPPFSAPPQKMEKPKQNKDKPSVAFMIQTKSFLLPKLSNVTLDPITAHPQLILSKDCKSISWGVSCQDLPKNPERFDVRPFVLGREGFAAGRHFWEVTVGREGIWAVGVARKSVRRKGPVEFAPDEGIWAVGRWNGQYRSIDPPLDPLLPLSGDLRRIRVNLNCAESQVCFFNADTGDHLYTFPVGSSFGEALHPYFYVIKNAQLRICP
uniref:Zinc finger protein RFP-like n=1 Tax=Varanus komodoensis TaxID=61221 RepID=A0A8D2KW37_VARKO